MNIIYRYGLILLLVFLMGCSDQSTPTTPAPEATRLPSPFPTREPSPQPTAERIPDGLVQNPVPASATETAASLLAAEHLARDDYRLALELLGITPAQLTPELPDSNYQVNDRSNFYINKNLGGDYQLIPARLRYISDNAAWWASVTNRVKDEEIIAGAQRFEELVLPIERLIFGKEWSPGIDNDRRVHFLLVEEPSWGGYFGYFSNINEYPTILQPFSNQREMLVINTGGVRLDSEAFAGELAHEYQHLIHWNNDANEDHWLNEAMGELATFLTGAPEASSALGETNAELFALNPDIQLTHRPELRYGETDKSTFMHYAAEKLFAIYLLEQFEPEFIKALVHNPQPGMTSIQDELDKFPDKPRFDDIYANWLLANLLNQPNLAEGQFGYKEAKPVLPAREVIQSFNDEPVANRLPPYGARYYEIRSDDTVKVSFNGSTLARLTPADPAGGQYAWYSNRGDESEFTLTRPFDLTGLQSATLNFKAWYELEEFYDFAYVEVSTDGGKTWEVLKTANGTDQDPFDRSFGVGYTGTTLEWVSESLDLSSYADQEILVRFSVLTDFTTNRDGFQVDEIRIPELGYFDGAEDNQGGWEARGFIRSTNLVPVNWVVWLIRLSIPTQVERIDVGTGQSATFEIAGFGKDFPFAAIVLSPSAPVTTSEVKYELVFQHP